MDNLNVQKKARGQHEKLTPLRVGGRIWVLHPYTLETSIISRKFANALNKKPAAVSSLACLRKRKARVKG